MSFTPAELCAAIQRRLPSFRVNYRPDFRDAIARSWPQSIDDSAARTHWGWRPRYDLDVRFSPADPFLPVSGSECALTSGTTNSPMSFQIWDWEQGTDLTSPLMPAGMLPAQPPFEPCESFYTSDRAYVFVCMHRR